MEAPIEPHRSDRGPNTKSGSNEALPISPKIGVFCLDSLLTFVEGSVCLDTFGNAR